MSARPLLRQYRVDYVRQEQLEPGDAAVSESTVVVAGSRYSAKRTVRMRHPGVSIKAVEELNDAGEEAAP